MIELVLTNRTIQLYISVTTLEQKLKEEGATFELFHAVSDSETRRYVIAKRHVVMYHRYGSAADLIDKEQRRQRGDIHSIQQ